MAKSKEQAIAQEMYINQLKTAKEIALKLKVQEKTVGNWINKNHWKNQRAAKVNNAMNGRENLKQVIANLAERRIEIFNIRAIASDNNDKETVIKLDLEAAQIADQVSKMNATLKSFDQSNRITAALYLEIMDDIFNALRILDESTYLLTLDFQENHALFISKKLG